MLSEMEADLTKWKEVGKMSDDELELWHEYLVESRKDVEVRQSPLAPTVLPTYGDVQPAAAMLDANIGNALRNHMERLNRSSTVTVRGRMRR